MLNCDRTCKRPFRCASRGPESIDEFVQHEFAIPQDFVVLVDLLSKAHEVLGLHLAQRFRRRAA